MDLFSVNTNGFIYLYHLILAVYYDNYLAKHLALKELIANFDDYNLKP